MIHLPYFLPHDYTGLPDRADAPPRAALRRRGRPAGEDQGVPGRHRRHAPAARHRPPDRRLGPVRSRRSASGPRGWRTSTSRAGSTPPQVAALFRGARAVVVPSLVYETFGYVVLEAFAEGTPVIVRDLGALPELVAESGGGLVFDSPEGLVAALDRLVGDADLRDRLGRQRPAPRATAIWSEAEHLDRYFDLIDEHRRARRVRIDRVHPIAAGPAATSQTAPRRKSCVQAGVLTHADSATADLLLDPLSANAARLNRADVAPALASRDPTRSRRSRWRGRRAPAAIASARAESRYQAASPPDSVRALFAQGHDRAAAGHAPRRPAGRSLRNPTGRAEPERSASRPCSDVLGDVARVQDHPRVRARQSVATVGPDEDQAVTREARPVPGEGVEDRRDVPPPRPLADEEEERARRPGRPPAALRRPRRASAGSGGTSARGRDRTTRSRSAGTPWTRATSRAVACEGTITRVGPPRGESISPAEPPAGRARGSSSGPTTAGCRR